MPESAMLINNPKVIITTWEFLETHKACPNEDMETVKRFLLAAFNYGIKSPLKRVMFVRECLANYTKS